MLTTHLESAAYVNLTLEALVRLGIRMGWTDDRRFQPGGGVWGGLPPTCSWYLAKLLNLPSLEMGKIKNTP